MPHHWKDGRGWRGMKIWMILGAGKPSTFRLRWKRCLPDNNGREKGSEDRKNAFATNEYFPL